jgi:RNA polymerase sporulation-specific sigma factor
MKIRFLNDIREFLLRIRLKYFSEKIYYINSPQMLPPPLKKAEEQELTERIANGDEKAREPLIVHNLRLVVYIAKKFESSGVNIEDLVSIGTIGLIKSVNTFCPDKNIKLATYASRCIENEILMHLRKVSKQKQEVSLFEPLNTDSEGNEFCISDILSGEPDEVSNNLDKQDEVSNLNLVLENLSKKEKEIMYMRYGFNGKSEMTQKQVADYFDISQSYISRIEKKILDKMKVAITKLA